MSGFYFISGFRYQYYILYTENTQQILFGFARSFKSCVHERDAETQTDGFFFSRLESQDIRNTDIDQEYFFHSCDYNNFSFHILCM